MVWPNTRAIDLKGRSLTPGFIYNDGDNSVPAGDLIKDSQWGGQMHSEIGGETIDQMLATMTHIVANEAVPNEPVFINLQDQWAAVAMKSWNISTLDEIAPNNPIMIFLDSS